MILTLDNGTELLNFEVGHILHGVTKNRKRPVLVSFNRKDLDTILTWNETKMVHYLNHVSNALREGTKNATKEK